MKIVVENIKPIRLGTKGQIICQRNVDDEEIAESLSLDIQNETDVWNFETTKMYALRIERTCYRAYVKFFRKLDGKPVFQLVDDSRLVNFNKSEMSVRIIKNEKLCNLRVIKLIMYGIGSYDNNDDEFKLIFAQLFQGKEAKAIYGLIEEKESYVHRCYAGDLLFEHEGKYKSFREVLIRERISYPSRIRENLNQRIFRIRARFLEANRKAPSVRVTVNLEDFPGLFFIEEEDEPIETIQGRFNIYEILGEGSYGKMIDVEKIFAVCVFLQL